MTTAQVPNTPLLTPASAAMLMAYVDDAPNWGGEPLLGGNIPFTAADRGNLTDLKRKGLLTTFSDAGDEWVQFTPAGLALAAELAATR